MNQTNKPKWSDVKRELRALDKAALIGAIGDMYKLSAGKSFYSSMESMLDGIAGLLFKQLELYNEVDVAQHLWRLQRDAAAIGWGYGDYLSQQIDKIRAHFGDQ
jgi:hypothetical protein